MSSLDLQDVGRDFGFSLCAVTLLGSCLVTLYFANIDILYISLYFTILVLW